MRHVAARLFTVLRQQALVSPRSSRPDRCSPVTDGERLQDSLTHAQHRLAELEHQLALFAQTLWRLVAEPWGRPFTPQQVKQGLCSGALKVRC